MDDKTNNAFGKMRAARSFINQMSADNDTRLKSVMTMKSFNVQKSVHLSYM
jgi:hypothetical protein